MILITSAAYVSPALVSEFGKLPPAMLPVQNKRLYRHQLELFPSGEHVVMSLPDDYELEEGDHVVLEDLGVEVVKVPVGLSLGQSVRGSGHERRPGAGKGALGRYGVL